MNKHYAVSLFALPFTCLALFSSADLAAVSTSYETRSVCKSKQAGFDRSPAVGIAVAHCVVDIRMANIKEYMVEQIKSGNGVPAMPASFTGSAGSRFVLTPGAGGNDNTNGTPGNDVEHALRQPFTALTQAMTRFTGQQQMLDLGSTPPWSNLPDLSGTGNYSVHSSLSIRGVDTSAPAAVPLPAAGVMFISGLFAFGGLVWDSRRRTGSRPVSAQTN